MAESKANLRVPGHGLLHEGGPFLLPGCCASADVETPARNHYDRIGHGVCRCGEQSPCLDSGAERKRWHREHRAAVLAAREGAVTP